MRETSLVLAPNSKPNTDLYHILNLACLKATGCYLPADNQSLNSWTFTNWIAGTVKTVRHREADVCAPLGTCPKWYRFATSFTPDLRPNFYNGLELQVKRRIIVEELDELFSYEQRGIDQVRFLPEFLHGLRNNNWTTEIGDRLNINWDAFTEHLRQTPRDDAGVFSNHFSQKVLGRRGQRECEETIQLFMNQLAFGLMMWANCAQSYKICAIHQVQDALNNLRVKIKYPKRTKTRSSLGYGRVINKVFARQMRLIEYPNPRGETHHAHSVRVGETGKLGTAFSNSPSGSFYAKTTGKLYKNRVTKEFPLGIHYGYIGYLLARMSYNSDIIGERNERSFYGRHIQGADWVALKQAWSQFNCDNPHTPDEFVRIFTDKHSSYEDSLNKIHFKEDSSVLVA